MDDQIARLERLCELDPSNINNHLQLIRVSKRSGEARYSRVVRDFISQLESASWTIPASVCWLKESLGDQAQDLAPVFAVLFDHDSPSIRRRAAWVLPELCSEAMVPGLAQLLESPDQDTRKTAVTVLSRLGPLAEAASAQLIAAMDDSSHDVRRIATACLLAIESVATPSMLSGLRSRDPLVRAMTCEHIGRNRNLVGLKPLLKALDDAQSRVRSAAALALGSFGLEAADAAPIIIDLLEDEQLPWRAMEALGRIGSPEAIEYLENSLAGAAWHLNQATVVRSICHTGSVGAVLVDPLLERILDSGPYFWYSPERYDIYDYEDEEIPDRWHFSQAGSFLEVTQFFRHHSELAQSLLLEELHRQNSYELRLAVQFLLNLEGPIEVIRERLRIHDNPRAELRETLEDIEQRLQLFENRRRQDS